MGSGYNEVKILKKKSEAARLIIEIILHLENLSGKKVKTVHSDNGGEFVSKVLQDFLKEKGIDGLCLTTTIRMVLSKGLTGLFRKLVGLSYWTVDWTSVSGAWLSNTRV